MGLRMTTDKQRTNLQNRSLHKYFELLAEELNKSPLTMQEVIDKFKVEVDWNKDNVKATIVRTAARALYPDMADDEGTVHTADLSTTQIQELYDNLDRWTASNFAIHVEWPSEESMYNESMKRFSKP